MIHDGRLAQALQQRYAGWQHPDSQAILDGRRNLEDLADQALTRNVDVAPRSGRQEFLENLVNRFSGT
jgi:xylose isomerase